MLEFFPASFFFLSTTFLSFSFFSFFVDCALKHIFQCNGCGVSHFCTSACWCQASWTKMHSLCALLLVLNLIHSFYFIFGFANLHLSSLHLYIYCLSSLLVYYFIFAFSFSIFCLQINVSPFCVFMFVVSTCLFFSSLHFPFLFCVYKYAYLLFTTTL